MSRFGFSPQVRTKAEGYVVRGHVEPAGQMVWRVLGSGTRPYIVNSDLAVLMDDEQSRVHFDFVTCTCPHGQNTPRPTCSHWCAVLLYEILRAEGRLHIALGLPEPD